MKVKCHTARTEQELVKVLEEAGDINLINILLRGNRLVAFWEELPLKPKRGRPPAEPRKEIDNG